MEAMVNHTRTSSALLSALIIALFALSACSTTVNPSRVYESKDVSACAVIKYRCDPNMGSFSDNTGCGCEPRQGTDNGTLVGNDRDAHGCIPSAGYSWCDAKQKCIRPWEENCAQQDYFTACPTEKPTGPVACTMDYNPVCGSVDNGIRCIRAPCPSTNNKTYSNRCVACADPKVYGYWPGACAS